MPDILYTYGRDNFSNLNLYNNQTLSYDTRLMITNSDYDPKIYQVTKVQEMTPQGVIKLSLKQDDFNEKRDNPQLRICDYYSEEGNIRVDISPSEDTQDMSRYTSLISWYTTNDKGELIPIEDETSKCLIRGKATYFVANFFNGENESRIDPEWKLTLINDSDYTVDDVNYYTNLVTVTEFDDSVVALKPGKAGSLTGKKFRLSVSDNKGNYYSSIDLEVK